MRATHLETKEVFALKQLEKVKIARLRKRHPNVNNEILMEKRVLMRLQHPGIVRLYHTFQVRRLVLRWTQCIVATNPCPSCYFRQDATHLYFLLEHIDGGELWNRLMDHGQQV